MKNRINILFFFFVITNFCFAQEPIRLSPFPPGTTIGPGIPIGQPIPVGPGGAAGIRMDSNVYKISTQDVKTGGWFAIPDGGILFQGQRLNIPQGAQYHRLSQSFFQFAYIPGQPIAPKYDFQPQGFGGGQLPSFPPTEIPQTPKKNSGSVERPGGNRSHVLFNVGIICDQFGCRRIDNRLCMGTPVMKTRISVGSEQGRYRYGVATAAHCIHAAQKQNARVRIGELLTNQQITQSERLIPEGYVPSDESGQTKRLAYRDVGLFLFTGDVNAIADNLFVTIGPRVGEAELGEEFFVHRHEGITKVTASKVIGKEDTIQAKVVGGRNIIGGDSGGAVLDKKGRLRSVMAAADQTFEETGPRKIDPNTGQEFMVGHFKPSDTCYFSATGIEILEDWIQDEIRRVTR